MVWKAGFLGWDVEEISPGEGSAGWSQLILPRRRLVGIESLARASSFCTYTSNNLRNFVAFQASLDGRCGEDVSSSFTIAEPDEHVSR